MLDLAKIPSKRTNILTNSCGLVIGSAVLDLAKYPVNVQTY